MTCLRYAVGLLPALGVLVSGEFAQAQETWDRDPLVTDRPTFTQSAATVDRGRVLFEGGYTLATVGDETAHTIGELAARVGFARRWEARVSVNPLLIVERPGTDDARGPRDVELGAKAHLIEASNGAVPELSVFGFGVVPVDGGDRPAVIPGLTVIAGWSLSDRVALGSNLGWVYDGVADDRFHLFRGSAVLGWSVDRRWGLFGEVFGLWPTGDRGSEHFANAGVAFLISPDVQLDLRLGTGLEGPWPKYFGGLGAAFRL